MREWAAAALAALDRGPAALVTVLATEGSVPREAGTRMVVSADGSFGTIGGGRLEWQAIDQARRLLGEPAGAWRVQDYPLGPLLGQCCGGRVRLVIERLGERGWIEAVRDGAEGLAWRFGAGAIEREREADGVPSLRWDDARGRKPAPGDTLQEAFDDRLPVALFGAGHVGRAVAPLLATLPVALGWYDSREDAAPATIVPEEALLDLARGAEGPVVIMTHDHALDLKLVAAALAGPTRFIGLIGSATKRARFLSSLRKDGWQEADLQRIHCPVGHPDVVGKEPAVIAVAVAAQLLGLR